MKQRPFSRSAIVKSAVVHVSVLLLIAISPGFDLPLKEKPVDVVWVELPKGTSDEIGWGVGPGPAGTGPSESPSPASLEQVPLAAVPKEPGTMPEPKPAKKPTIQKTVTAKPRMTYTSKTAKRRKRGARTKTDRKIADALAMIDRSLEERGSASDAAPTGGGGGGGGGYKYGTGTQPLRVAPSDPEYLKYQALVRARIIGNWIVPERFASQGKSANARLIVMINMNGEVISTRWSKKSGISSFDESTKRAVERASPFPKPPQRLAWETYNEGFLIEFDARAQ